MELIDLKNEVRLDKLESVANCIRNGGLVVFPTETVYGIGANALDKEAVANIFKAKGRPSDNPLIVHISNMEMLNGLVSSVNSVEQALINTFWPGPLTVIFPKKDVLPDNVTCGLDTVGIRMPQNNIALKLIELSKTPIAAPSANISGRPSGTDISDIYLELKEKVDYMIDGSTSDIGVESTVVKVVDGEVLILRPGKISPEDIESLGLKVKLDKHLFESISNNEKVESPGMKHRHYAPTTKTVLVDCSDSHKVKEKILELLEENVDKNLAVISYDENEKLYKDMDVKFLSLGNLNDLNSVSKNVFTTLRKVDNLDVDLCIIQGVEKRGIGIAIMNRLVRACEHNVINL